MTELVEFEWPDVEDSGPEPLPRKSLVSVTKEVLSGSVGR